MRIRRKIAPLFASPKGKLGWVMARIMPVFSDGQSRQLIELLNLQPDDEFLEIACGAGSLLFKYTAHVSFIAGIDHSEIQINFARRRNQQRIVSGTAEIVFGDSAALPWSTGRFSVVGSNCFSCLADPQESLKEMYRVLRPKGRMALVTDYYADEKIARKSEQIWGLPALTEEELRTMIETAAFSQVKVYKVSHTLVATAIKESASV